MVVKVGTSTFIIIPQGKTSSIKMDFLYRKLYSFSGFLWTNFTKRFILSKKNRRITGG